MSELRLGDEELRSRARDGSSGDSFADLDDGNIATFDSLRKATRVYCQILATEQRGYTDTEQIDRLVQQSGLMHSRWTEDDYREEILSELTRRDAGDEANEAVLELFEDVFDHRGLDTDHVAGTQDDPRSLRDVVGPADSLREAILRYRREATHYVGHTRDEKTRVIAEVVVDDLRQHGRLINPAVEDTYYFDKRETRVHRVHDPKFKALIEGRYDLMDNAEGKAIVSRIESVATREGDEAEVHRLFYYSESTGKLCVHDRGGGYYAIGGAGIDHHENGENGVFFLPSDAKRFEYTLPNDRPSSEIDVPGERPDADTERDTYRRVLVNRANFVGGIGLTPEEQRILFDLYLHTLPFGELMPEKPILAFQGPKRSGKSGTQRMLGQFLCHSSWDVRNLNSRDDFWAAVTNNPFVAYDQLDSMPDWLNDALASVATGTMHSVRKLYTTNEEVQYHPKCWLAINSRTPNFNRDDVASRLIIFTFGHLDSVCARRSFNRPLREHRNVLWSQYVDTLQEIAARLADDPEYASSSFRMADWVHVAKAAAEPLGYDENTVEQLVEKLAHQQANFALSDAPQFHALQAVKRELDGNPLTTDAKGLHEDLLNQAHEEQIEYEGTPRSLSMWISHHRDELETLLDLEVIETDRANRYRLPP